jgi:hypothetical protein
VAEPAGSPRALERTPPARGAAPRKSSGSGAATREVEIVSLDKLPVSRKSERAPVVEEIPVPDGPDEEEVAERRSSKKARQAAEKEELVFKQAPPSKAEAARAAKAAARDEAKAKAKAKAQAPLPPPENDNPLKAAIRASILKDSGAK